MRERQRRGKTKSSSFIWPLSWSWTPLNKVLNLGFQKGIRDPVATVRQITNLIGKWKDYNNSSLEVDNSGCLMHLTKLLEETNESHYHQDIKLLNFEIHKESTKK